MAVTGTDNCHLVPIRRANEPMSTEILIKISILVGVFITIMLVAGEYYS